MLVKKKQNKKTLLVLHQTLTLLNSKSLQQWKATPILTFVLLLILLPVFFAAKCGFLLGAGGGNNGHLPGAIAIIALLEAVPST